MNTRQITMSKPAALAKLEAAERQMRRRRSPDWRLEALRSGYAALAAGTPLISLGAEIGRAGWDAEGRPRLAVARSDRTRVSFQATSSWGDRRASVLFRTSSGSTTGNHRGRPGPTMVRSVPLRLFPPRDNLPRPYTGVAIVPLVPPDVLEAAGNPSLKGCFTLFEADWEDIPVDPILLRHLGGDLYAVLAAWNLTDLERAVLSFEAE